MTAHARDRFRAPQPPLPVEGIYNSSQTFDMCPQRTVCQRPLKRLTLSITG